MKLVMRSNKQTCVADERLDDFLKRGFVEVDGKTGEPLRPPEEKEERGGGERIASGAGAVEAGTLKRAGD